MGYNHTGEGYNTDMGPTYTQIFAQELGNTNLVEYHKEPRPLTIEPSQGVGSSPIKATKLSANGSNLTTYSDIRDQKMVTPQKVLLLQAEPGQGEETSGVTTSNPPDHQNIHKST